MLLEIEFFKSSNIVNPLQFYNFVGFTGVVAFYLFCWLLIELLNSSNSTKIG